MFVLEVITADHTDRYEFSNAQIAIELGQSVYNKNPWILDVKVYPKK